MVIATFNSLEKVLTKVCRGSHQNPTDYAIRESSTSVKLFKKLKEGGSLDVGFQAEGLSGGVLLGVKGQGGIGLFDWETGTLVRRIEVEPREVCVISASSNSLFNWILGLLE